jgi:hypothetical protein
MKVRNAQDVSRISMNRVDLNKPLEPVPKPMSGKPPLVPGGLKRFNVNISKSDNQKITPGAAVRAQIKRVTPADESDVNMDIEYGVDTPPVIEGSNVRGGHLITPDEAIGL